jgi:hypothetical protein
MPHVSTNTVWSAQYLNWSIMTRARAPQQTSWWWAAGRLLQRAEGDRRPARLRPGQGP